MTVKPSQVTADDIAELLSEGLDLCVRARKLDEAVTRALAAGGIGDERPLGGTGTRCMTPALWVQDAYDQDCAAWEARAREKLTVWLFANRGPA